MNVGVAELADAPALGAGGENRESSTLSPDTEKKKKHAVLGRVFRWLFYSVSFTIIFLILSFVILGIRIIKTPSFISASTPCKFTSTGRIISLENGPQ